MRPEQETRERRVVRLTRQAEPEPRRRRELRWEYDENGYLRFRGRLPAEIGARLIAAVDAIATRANPARECSAERTGTPTGETESLATRRAEALISLVTGEKGADHATDVVVHISLDDPERLGHEPAARIADGPALPGITAERLACTAARPDHGSRR
ncbi:MAG: DUF222 domain-containing protein [Pseudonocardia sp.]|nr:DUF222 domain-containing protein [Pseudonocardia sp.]MBO0875926.1 DUF222 domain-containing protein [Pseudonocardia sp.]